MDWSSRAPVVEARALRHDLGLLPGDQVDPFAIAKLRGIEIVNISIGATDRVEGAFLRRDGRDFMLLNAAKPGRKQRFTSAHELGHAVMIPPTEDAEFVDTDANLDDQAGIGEERDANLFAAELLMPEVGVNELVAPLERHADAVGAIVRRYNVSPLSGAVRLCGLRGLDRAEMALLRDFIEKNWRTFWREQNIPRDVKPDLPEGLPEQFRVRAERLLEAGVISPERHAELIDRPLVHAG